VNEALIRSFAAGLLVSVITVLSLVASRAADRSRQRWLVAAVVSPVDGRARTGGGILAATQRLGWWVARDTRGRAIAGALGRTRWGLRAARQLELVGRDPSAAGDWLLGALTLGVGAAVAGAGIGTIVSVGTAVLLAASGWALVVLGSSSVLGGAVAARRDAVARDLPLAVDVIAAALSAGAHVDRAILAYVTTSGGPLAEELRATMLLVEAGYRRQEAYRRVTDRVGVADLRALLFELSRIGEQGSVDPASLRAMAADIRARQRHSVQERAARAPLQMLFPIALLIMPALFLIVLGPVVVRLVSGSFI